MTTGSVIAVPPLMWIFCYTISPLRFFPSRAGVPRATLIGMSSPSIYEAAGGAPAMLALATNFHARCLADPMLEHPFSHGTNPEHVQRLADYWGEVLGGPPVYSGGYGGHTHMLDYHAHHGMQPELGDRFVAVFDEAVAATLPADDDLRRVLHDYMRWATDEVLSYDPPDTVVPRSLPTPQWGYAGPITPR
jgi:hemoglobin